MIEVSYLKEMPKAEEGQLQSEEQKFIESLAEQLERIINKRETEKTTPEPYAKLDMAMKAGNMAWWEMDIPTENVVFDKRKAAMLGYPPERFGHYRDFTELIHPEDYDNAMNAMLRHYKGETDKYEVEYRILTQSGIYKWFYDFGTVVEKGLGGIPLKITGLVIDISTQKERSSDNQTCSRH